MKEKIVLWRKQQKSRYLADLDYLIALIVYLGSYEPRWARSAKSLANEISLDEAKVLDVLGRYPGIFRKSIGPKRGTNDYYYSLLFRYAQRKYIELPKDGDEIDPLEPDKLKMILDFVAQVAEMEQENIRMNIAISTSVLAAFVALIAAAIAAYGAITAAGIRAAGG